MQDVKLAKSAGFCFGVKRAVDMVYENIDEKEPIYTYGEIIHNESVVSDLSKKGVQVIHDVSQLSEKEKGKIIIRSHGVSKEIYDGLSKNGMKVVDATCPFVLKIHRIVEEMVKKNKHIVIIGDKNHPEVQGIMGWCNSSVTVIATEEEAKNFECKNKEIHIVSQTTFQEDKFSHLVEIISKKHYNRSISNTICNATCVRQKEAREIAKDADAMIVIGGRNSSNTRKLYEISKEECPDTFLIGGLEELDLEQLKTAKRIGITAGASTPNNIIQEVYTSVRTEF